MRQLLLFCGLGAALAATAQPAWEWGRNGAGTGNETGWAICTDAEGNSFVAGSFNGPSLTFGTTQLVNPEPDHADIFLVKYDPAGQVLWARSGTGYGYDNANALAADAQGHVFMAGIISGSWTLGGDTLVTQGLGGYDAFLAKYDADGTLLWDRQISGMADESVNGLAVDANGDVLIAGEFSSDIITLGGIELQNASTGSSTDGLLARYDANGELLWARTARGPGYEGVFAVDVDGDGNAVITGSFGSAHLALGTDTLDNGQPGLGDVFIAKYGPQGELLWATSVPATDDQSGHGVAVDIEGDVVISGKFKGASFPIGDTTLQNTVFFWFDAFVAKYHADGSFVWAACGGGNLDDEAWAVDTDPENNVVFCGISQGELCSYGDLSYTSYGLQDMVAAKYSPDGELLWLMHEGGDGDDMALDMAIDPFGQALFTGAFGTDTVALSGSSLINSGYQDLWVLKLGTQSTGLAEVSPANLQVYPVPSSGAVTVACDRPISQLVVYDAMGRTVYQARPKAQQALVYVEAPGTYVASITVGTSTLTRRLVVVP